MKLSIKLEYIAYCLLMVLICAFLSGLIIGLVSLIAGGLWSAFK